LLSLLMPGNTPSSVAFQPAVRALEQLTGWTAIQRQAVILRSDGGCGTDGNINWQLWRGYQVMTKGFSGKRARNQAALVQTWESVRPGLWVAPVVQPRRYARRTRQFLRRWLDEHQEFRYAIQIHTLHAHSHNEAVCAYDQRGAMECEIQGDKRGLYLARRRKHRLNAQEALLLLTDISHNTVAWLRPWMFADSHFADWGALRIIRDLFTIPGDVVLKDGKLVKVRLARAHPYAPEMVKCLTQLLEKFENPVS
jgi:hypothetical protein